MTPTVIDAILISFQLLSMHVKLFAKHSPIACQTLYETETLIGWSVQVDNLASETTLISLLGHYGKVIFQFISFLCSASTCMH